jgi:hypothetical protein
MSGYEPLHCSACSQIIGAYEPMVVRVQGTDRESSLAAEPELPIEGAEHLHIACVRASSPQTAEVVELTRPPPAHAPDLAPRGTTRRGRGRVR